MFSSVAMASAQTPWFDCGWLSRRRRLPESMKGLRPPMMAPYCDIISVPPATTRSAKPAMIVEAARLVVVMPEPQ